MTPVLQILWSLFVILPIGGPSSRRDTGDTGSTNDTGSDERKQDSSVDAASSILPALAPIVVPPLMVQKTLVTITPSCGDNESEKRLRMASLRYLSQVDGLPYDISFEVKDCADKGAVDMSIIEVPKN